MAVLYHLIVINNSEDAGDVCVFQPDPGAAISGETPAAWLTRACGPGVQLNFEWQIDNPELVPKIGPGTGVSGSGIFMLQAGSDSTRSANLKFFITFGRFQPGEVREPEKYPVDPVEISYPTGVFFMKAIFNPDNTWTVESGI